MKNEHNDWVELIGELPESGFIAYGSQKLRFEENPSQGYRRVERLKQPYRADKVQRMYPALIRVYDPESPEVLEQNMKARLLRERDKWMEFLGLSPDALEGLEWTGEKWVKKEEEPKPVDTTAITGVDRETAMKELTRLGVAFHPEEGTKKLQKKLAAALKAETESAS